MCKVTIDGVAVEVPEGSTILDAAKLASVDIPTLCYMAKINEIGSCRVCVVEVEGQDGLAAACNTPVFDGMSVRTATPRAISARRQNVKTILAGHRSECTTCKRSGTCALQNLANSLGVADLERDP
ncbi:MAG: 2Fe-2S iron-sulfur cluster-binding protein, partial [Ellagibacter isourolithinifaciens]